MIKEFLIWTPDPASPSANETVSLYCGALAATHFKIEWYKDDQLIDDSLVIRRDTEYSFRAELQWNKISEIASGNYTCYGHRIDGEVVSKSCVLSVENP